MDEKVKEVVNMLEKAVIRDIIVYDMRNYTPFYDYAIICSANTSRQASAAINYVRKDTTDFDFDVKGYHSSGDSKWHLVDLGDIVVHVFVGDEREKYNLDGMYSMKDIIVE
jgi:ribosome-associated protein